MNCLVVTTNKKVKREGGRKEEKKKKDEHWEISENFVAFVIDLEKKKILTGLLLLLMSVLTHLLTLLLSCKSSVYLRAFY